jgi:hypothetical protein
MAAATVFYWIVKNNKKVLIEAGEKAAEALRKGGARKATKQEVLDRPARRRRLTQDQAEKLYPPKPRKSPSGKPTKTLSPEAKAQADRLRDLSQQSGVPITSEAQAKAFEAFAKGGTRKWWNGVSPKKKATMAAAAGFATIGGFYAWLSTGKGKPDFAAARRAEERAKRKALPGLSLTREQALLKDKKPAKTNGSAATESDKRPIVKAAKLKTVLPRGAVANGITRYNSGSFDAAYATERAKAMKAGEPDTGEFYWKGTKYTTKIKSKKPPEDKKRKQKYIDKKDPRPETLSGRGLLGHAAPGTKVIKGRDEKGELGFWEGGIRKIDIPFLGEVEFKSRPIDFPDKDRDQGGVTHDKKGGQIGRSMKKAKPKGRATPKTRKRAALRGHRAELRGG